MRGRFTLVVLAMLLGAETVSLCAQQVVDRIVARIEDDIILQSEVRELGRFQQLLDGRQSGDAELLEKLISQWIVNAEATAARYPQPTEAAVKREVERIEKLFASPEAYRQKLREAALTEAAVRRLAERQLYLARYLDYKFRPAVQVDRAQVEAYYREQLAPQLAKKSQTAPPLEEVQDQIRELLIQRGINERAAKWLDETRARIKVEISLTGATP